METTPLKPAAGNRLVAPALFVAVVAISFAAIFFKKSQPTHPVVAAGIRLAIAALLFLPMALRSWRQGKGSRQLIVSGLWAGVFYALHFGTWVTSLTLTSVASSVTLVTATPLLLGVYALVAGTDKPEKRHWISIALALVGLSVIGSHDSQAGNDALLGDLFAFGGAAAMAGYMLISRRLGESLDIWIFGGLATSVGAATLLGTALLLDIPIQPSSDEALMYLALAALVPQLIGHNLLTWSLRHTRPTVVGISTIGEPIGAALLGWLWLGEAVSSTVGLGCSITLAAVVLAVWKPK